MVSSANLIMELEVWMWVKSVNGIAVFRMRVEEVWFTNSDLLWSVCEEVHDP